MPPSINRNQAVARVLACVPKGSTASMVITDRERDVTWPPPPAPAPVAAPPDPIAVLTERLIEVEGRTQALLIGARASAKAENEAAMEKISALIVTLIESQAATREATTALSASLDGMYATMLSRSTRTKKVTDK